MKKKQKPVISPVAGGAPPKPKHAGGRPSKLTEELALNIFMLGRKGLTDEEIAKVCFVDKDTIRRWKKQPEFFGALKEAKDVADSIVERSLYERANGYEHPEEKIFFHLGRVVRVKTMKYYPPDPTSMIFFLKNRKPEVWRERIPELSNIADELGSALKQLRRHYEKKIKTKN